MTFKDLEEKMEKGKIYPICSKEEDEDGHPFYAGRCRLNEDGRLECGIRPCSLWVDEELPQGPSFFIEKDEDLTPWIITVNHKDIK